jgi:hypothetical protein
MLLHQKIVLVSLTVDIKMCSGKRRLVTKYNFVKRTCLQNCVFACQNLHNKLSNNGFMVQIYQYKLRK